MKQLNTTEIRHKIYSLVDAATESQLRRIYSIVARLVGR